uniref:Fungal lipase-like domain-containing protein n=1 Tax=Meloidogyne javanica TaxID=6303 RepID=A0A915MCS5_MELJA
MSLKCIVMDMKAKSVQDLLLYLMMIKQSFCHFEDTNKIIYEKYIQPVIVAIHPIRGTNSFTQLLLESSEIAYKSQTEVNIGGKVATYFTEIYEQLKAEGIINCAINLIKIYTDYELWITGHSLGGALASLAAAEIASCRLISAQNIKLLTLGQPRTGNWVWAAAMDQILPYYNYRVVNHRDVIVHLPMRFFEGYHHYSTEIWYNNGMDGNEDGEEDTFIVCNNMDEDDDNCSNSLWQLKIFLKNNYFFIF